MISIADMLKECHVEIIEPRSRLSEVRMLPTWQRLWTEFGAYAELRDHLIGAARLRPFIASSMGASTLAAHLLSVGLIKGSHGAYEVASGEAGRLLRGAWLEELGAIVAGDAGADEVCLSQKLRWRSRYSDEFYENEIDVLARYKDRMAFVSCKALAPRSAETASGAKRIFDAIKEVAYWRQHFGHGRGCAVLLTTADFIDEAQHKPRNAALLEHADVLDVRLVSADLGNAQGLADAFRSLITTL